jgi:hypothetical protein
MRSVTITRKPVDTLLDFANESVRLIGGYAVVIVPLALIPLAPISVITLLLYTSILTDIPAWAFTYIPLRLLICAAIAIGLEGFALICLIVSSRAEEWNLSKEPDEPRLNQSAGRWALAAYIILGMGMVVVGEILPHYEVFQSAQIARWTLLGFFLLAPFGHWLFSTEAAIRRLETRRRERQEQAEATEDRGLARAKEELELKERQAALEIQLAQAEAQRLQAEAQQQKQQAAVIRAEARKEAGITTVRAGKKKRQPRTSPEFDRLLEAVHEQAGFEPFGQGQVQEWTGRGKTSVYALLGYGEEVGRVEQVGRGVYVYRNGTGR